MLCTIYDLSLKAAGSPGHRPGESALLSIWFRTVKLCHKDGKSSSTKQFLSNVFLQVQLIKSFFCWHLELAYYLPMNICFSWSGHKWLGKAFAWARLQKKICYWLLPKLLILFCSCHPDWLLRNDIFIIDSFLFSESCNKTKEKEQKTKLLKKLKKKKKQHGVLTMIQLPMFSCITILSHIGRLICTQEDWKLCYEHRTMSVCRPWPYFETVGIRNVSENLNSVMWAKLGRKMHNT